jgi:pimeloyl-ACP methyl ester carboxylesterase
MRQSILKLYRSADGLRFKGPWVDDLAKLPRHGQVFWGEADVFVQLSVAERFAAKWKLPLHVAHGAGHWACYERAAEFASLLRTHWSR